MGKSACDSALPPDPESAIPPVRPQPRGVQAKIKPANSRKCNTKAQCRNCPANRLTCGSGCKSQGLELRMNTFFSRLIMKCSHRILPILDVENVHFLLGEGRRECI